MKRASWILLLTLLVGCGPAVHTPGQVTPQNKLLKADFNSIQANILNPKCVGCHSRGGRNPDAARIPFESIEDLLNSPRDLVVPKDPDSSGIVISIRPGAKKPMPPSGGSLTDDEIAIIVEWIANGAAN